MVAMDEKALHGLRQKLQALNYVGDIGLESAPLIARLVEDLVHTTESYRSLKLGLAKRGQEAEQWQSKADALRRDAERVLQENNRLHMDMLEMTEKLQQRDRAEFVAQKSLRDEIAQLKLVKRDQAARIQALEAESEGLRSLVNSTGAGTAGATPILGKLEISAPMPPAHPNVDERPDAPPRSATEKASDAQERRIRALERETRDLRAANAALRERMAEASEMTAAREREIARLSGKLQQERDLDRLALQYRNEASEKLVASLNAQIDVLSARAAELEEQVGPMEEELRAAVEARGEAERRLHEAAQENEKHARDMATMRATVAELRESYEKQVKLNQKMEATAEREKERARSRGRGRGRGGGRRGTSEGPAAQHGRGASEEQLEEMRALKDAHLAAVAALRASEEERKRLEEEAARREAGGATGGVDDSFQFHERVAELESELEAARKHIRTLESTAATVATSAVAERPGGEAVEADPARPAVSERDDPEAAARLSAMQRRCESLERTIAVLNAECDRLQSEVARAHRSSGRGENEGEREREGARVRELERRLLEMEMERTREREGPKEGEGWERTRELEDRVKELERELERAASGEAKGRELEERVKELEGMLRIAEEREKGREREGQEDRGTAEWRVEAERLRGRVRGVEEELERARREREEREREAIKAAEREKEMEEQVEQLKALVSSADATREQLVSKLRDTVTALRAAEVRMRALEGEAEEAKREAEAAREAAREARGAVGKLDVERDALAAELDEKEREGRRAQGRLEELAEEMRGLREELSRAEARVTGAEARADEAEEATAAHKSRADAAESRTRTAESEAEALREEVEALAADLTAVQRENQMVNAELAEVARARDATAAEMEGTARRLVACEGAVLQKERELSDMVAAYQELAAENRRQAKAVVALERDVAGVRRELQAQAEETESVRRALAAAQAENREMVVDLQAQERQADALAREVQRLEAAMRSKEAEKEGLAEQLRHSRGVQLQADAGRLELQRELAAAETHCQMLQARLQDAAQDISVLEQRLSAEQTRVRDLERLLADARHAQQRSGAMDAHASTRVHELGARLRAAEEERAEALRRVAELEGAMARGEEEKGGEGRGEGSESEVVAALRAQCESLHVREIEAIGRARALEAALAEERERREEREGQERREGRSGEEAEARCRELEGALEAERRGAARLRAESSRLVAALAAGQEARGQLQAANAELMSELAEMRSRSGAGVDVAEALADMRRHYEGMLRRERDRREAAETGAGSDVRERLEELMERGGEGQVDSRVAGLLARVARMEEERRRLSGVVAEMRGTMDDVAREVERAHSEYSSANASMEEAASFLDGSPISSAHSGRDEDEGGTEEGQE